MHIVKPSSTKSVPKSLPKKQPTKYIDLNEFVGMNDSTVIFINVENNVKNADVRKDDLLVCTTAANPSIGDLIIAYDEDELPLIRYYQPPLRLVGLLNDDEPMKVWAVVTHILRNAKGDNLNA